MTEIMDVENKIRNEQVNKYVDSESSAYLSMANETRKMRILQAANDKSKEERKRLQEKLDNVQKRLAELEKQVAK
jgi:hypothetical protein